MNCSKSKARFYLYLAFTTCWYLDFLQPDIFLAMKSYGLHHDAGLDLALDKIIQRQESWTSFQEAIKVQITKMSIQTNCSCILYLFTTQQVIRWFLYPTLMMTAGSGIDH